jgi:GTPase Era involved in 16S rRNA processing
MFCVQLIGQEVCAASCKHNTTRSNARAVLNSGDVQIVFLDTPGVVDEETAKKFKLGIKIYNTSRNFSSFMIQHDLIF